MLAGRNEFLLLLKRTIRNSEILGVSSFKLPLIRLVVLTRMPSDLFPAAFVLQGVWQVAAHEARLGTKSWTRLNALTVALFADFGFCVYNAKQILLHTIFTAHGQRPSSGRHVFLEGVVMALSWVEVPQSFARQGTHYIQKSHIPVIYMYKGPLFF